MDFIQHEDGEAACAMMTASETGILESDNECLWCGEGWRPGIWRKVLPWPAWRLSAVTGIIESPPADYRKTGVRDGPCHAVAGSRLPSGL